MTRLVWDQPGDRLFQSGCDRGVLYPTDAPSVPWNGLTAVTEEFNDIVLEEFYLDGIKYLNRRTTNNYSGTLKALTYPDEFMVYDGVVEMDAGFSATNQPVISTFGLSYRTKIGNDLVGTDFGYKLHILYNLTAIPDSQSSNTQNASLSAEEFSWKLSGVPVAVDGKKPAVHFIIDSTKVRYGYMAVFEDYLYGSSNMLSELPDIAELALIYQTVAIDTINEPIAAII